MKENLNSEVVKDLKEIAEKQCKKTSKLLKQQLKLENQKKEIEEMAKSNQLLAQYLDVVSQLSNQQKLIDEQREITRIAMQEADLPSYEDKVCKLNLKRDYTKTVIDTKLFYEKYKPTSKIYQNVVIEQSVKGSLNISTVQE